MHSLSLSSSLHSLPIVLQCIHGYYSTTSTLRCIHPLSPLSALAVVYTVHLIPST